MKKARTAGDKPPPYGRREGLYGPPSGIFRAESAENAERSDTFLWTPEGQNPPAVEGFFPGCSGTTPSVRLSGLRVLRGERLRGTSLRALRSFRPSLGDVAALPGVERLPQGIGGSEQAVPDHQRVLRNFLPQLSRQGLLTFARRRSHRRQRRMRAQLHHADQFALQALTLRGIRNPTRMIRAIFPRVLR